ncbi:10605_t:CDS:2, partial [Racocetra persica]
NSKTDIIINSPIYQESHTNNIVIIVDGEQQAKALQPIYCNLSKQSSNTFIHVVVTGKERGMCGEELKKIKFELPECHISVHDLGIRNRSSDNENFMSSIFTETTRMVNQLRPIVLIYIKNLDDFVMRGIDAATIATSKINEFTKIAIPIEHMNNIMFITDLPIEALKQWNTPKFRIQVITYERPASLKRLVESLRSSIYLGDNVPLTINIDEGADLRTIEYSHAIEWPFGKKNILRRTVQGGLVANIVESYYPAHNNDYAFIFEDDIEVSPFFYIWAKYTILKYRYGPDRIFSNRMFGVSLYNSKHIELTLPKHTKFNAALVLDSAKYNRRSPYLSQIPCSWGSVLFPEIWREFHHYISVRLKNPNLQDINIPESRSNRWHNSWKRYFIELVYLRGYVMLYPNYINFVSLSTNHHEKGVHVHKETRKGFLLPLMKHDIISEGLPNGGLPNYRNLPTLDLFGTVVPFKTIVERGHNLHRNISLCPPSNSEILTYDPKDLLCIDESKKIIEPKKRKKLKLIKLNKAIKDEQTKNKAIKDEQTKNKAINDEQTKNKAINDKQTKNKVINDKQTKNNVINDKQTKNKVINDEQTKNKPIAAPIIYKNKPIAAPIINKNKPIAAPIINKINPDSKSANLNSKSDQSKR